MPEPSPYGFNGEPTSDSMAPVEQPAMAAPMPDMTPAPEASPAAPDNNQAPAQDNDNPVVKEIQSLTGTLAQKIRENSSVIDGNLIKYIYNSFASAIDTSVLDESDLNDIVNKLQSKPAPKEGGEQPAPAVEPMQAPAQDLNEYDEVPMNEFMNITDHQIVKDVLTKSPLNVNNKFELLLFLEGLYMFYVDNVGNTNIPNTIAKIKELLDSIGKDVIDKINSALSVDELEDESIYVYKILTDLASKETSHTEQETLLEAINNYIKNK